MDNCSHPHHAVDRRGKEIKHLFTAIEARIEGAVDAQDWAVIKEQLREATTLAGMNVKALKHHETA